MIQSEAQMISTPVTASNPYVGPQPFQKKDRHRFFGRESEANALISLVESERLVLFYAQSGAGKSSLINARLIPTLEEHGFAILPVGRVSGQSLDYTNVKNIYIYNLLLSLNQSSMGKADPLQMPRQLAEMELRDYLAALPIEDSASEQAATGSRMPAYELQPLVLIIDQFEELFTTCPAAWKQRGPFFIQLAEAMQSDPSLWIVLSMREDYVAALDPYVRLLPGRLRMRYSMERMGPDAAFRAVTLPVQNLRPFEDSAARSLVNNLQMIVTGRDDQGQPVFAPGQFVEPVQLQVVCFQLWEALRSSPGQDITHTDLEHLAQGKELAHFVSAALANFYEKALQEVRELFPLVSERQLREWFSRELITEGETRSAVRQDKERTGTPPNDLPNAVVQALQNRFIIRSENRGDTTWCELSHDRFVAPILSSNREWQQRNPQRFELEASAWLNSGYDLAKLLDGSQLRQAEVQLSAHPEEISPNAQRLIKASRDYANKRDSQRQRVALFSLCILLIVLVGLLIAAVRNGQALTHQNSTIVAAQQLAIAQNRTITVALGQVGFEKVTAEAASTLAFDQKQVAEVASTLAFDQKQKADAARVMEALQRQSAEAQSRLSLARELATLSETYLTEQTDLSLLLGVQSLQVSNTWEGRKALLEGLQHNLSREITQEGQPIYGTTAVLALAFSPDGQQVAISSKDNPINVWDIPGGRSLPLPVTLQTFSNADAIAYNPLGNILAIGDEYYHLAIWNIDTGEVRVDQLINIVNDLAFHPEGKTLALATRFNRVILWDPINNRQIDLIGTPNPATTFHKVAWSHYGSHLAIAGTENYLAIWDVQEQPTSVLLKNNPHFDTRGVFWTPDDKFLISAGYEGNLVRWDMTTRTAEVISNPANLGPLLTMASSPNGLLLVTGNLPTEAPLTLWDPQKLVPIQRNMGGHSNSVTALTFSAKGDRMASGDASGKVVFWKVRTQQPLSNVVTNLKGGNTLALSVDAQGQPFVLFGKDKLQTWNATGQLTAPLVSLPLTGYRVTLAADDQGPLAAIGNKEGQVTIYHLNDGQPDQVITGPGGPVESVALSADGSKLVIIKQDQMQVFHLRPGQPPTLQSATGSNSSGPVAIRADGKVIAFRNKNTGVSLFDTTTNSVFTVGPGGEKPVITSLALSPDGELLAIGYEDGSVVLRDGQNQRPIGKFEWEPDGPITGMAFAQPAGKPLRLFVLTQPGTLTEWDVDLTSWRQRACELAGRRFTDAEWSQYIPEGSEYQPACLAEKTK